MPRRGGLGTLGSGKGRRRTVLQLGETPRDPTFGFGYQPIVEPDNSRVEPPISKPVNALGGLLSHYGESESEEEEEPEERRPKSILRVGGYDTSAHRSKSKSGDNYKKMKFVAATRSISTPTEDLSPAPPPAQATPEPDRNGQDKPEVKDEIDAKVFDFLAEINADEEPQENGDTGDKTTDDEKEPDIAAKEVTDDLASDARKEESDSDSEEELTEPIEPTTVWQHCLDDGTQHYYYWNIETNVVTWEIPPDYSQYLLLLKEYEEKLSKYQSELEVRKNKPKKKDKGTSKKSDSESTVEAPTKEPENEADTSVSSSTVSLVPYEETPEVVKTKPRVEIGPQLPPNFVSAEADAPSAEQKAEKEETLPQESEIEWQSDEIGDSNSAAILKEEVVVDKKTDASAKDDLEKASKIMETLEKEFARRCDAPEEVPVEEDAAAAETEVQEEDDDFDFDDIDQQLDMALERKLKSNADTEKEKSENVSRPEKRSLVNYSEDDPEIEAKKQKKEHDFGGDVDKDDADYSEYSATTDEVNDLSQLVADKLEFLDVSSKNLTKLQIILIETETRLSDWREGALASDFMLGKLKEANLRLEQYESTAAPPGWSCHFDRSYKRYFYCHHVTGETQWDYPEGAGAEGEASDTLQADLRDVAKHPPPPPPPEEPQPRAKELPEPDDIMMSGFAPGSPVKITEQEAPENTSPEPMASPDVEQNPSIAADLADDIKLCAKPPPPPDEPPPPGTEPPLPPESTYSLVSLAAAPPPPPPPEEPTSSTSVYDVTAQVAEVYHTYEHEMETDTTQPDNDSAHISAPPVINRTSVQLKESVERNNSDEHHVSKPAVALTVDSTPVTEQAPVESAAPAAPAPTHTPSSKKKKKDKDKEKALVAGGLNLKKKKLPSLVQKWQQVQKEVD